jgi:hypothetical protein
LIAKATKWLTTQTFARGRDEMVSKAATAKVVFTRRFRICQCIQYLISLKRCENLRCIHERLENLVKKARKQYDN